MKMSVRLHVTSLENRETPATLAAGFAEQIMASGLAGPTAIEFTPDGKMYVAELNGTMEVWENGTRLQENFFRDAPIFVGSGGERGLAGLTLDPNFEKNRHVYVYYTTTLFDGRNRVSRFTANAAGDLALPGSEQILVTLDPNFASAHNGGSLAFGPDGKLYVATGDATDGQNSQWIGNRHGKILRYNPDGSIPSGAEANPSSFPGIAGTTSGVNRAIWAVGLRNPFRIAFDPVTGVMHINDVGSGGVSAAEEINVGQAGANYGWPLTEGYFNPIFFPEYTNPLYAYPHSVGRAITGGAFYQPDNTMFPTDSVGDYYFTDLTGGWIKSIDLATQAVTDLAADIVSPVDLRVHPDGSLYYVSFDTHTVFRIYSAPRVVSAVVNDGSAQRSRVTDVTLTFNSVVNFNGDSFLLSRDGGDSVKFEVSHQIVNSVSVVTLSNFFGSETDPNLGARSLRDGRYTLTVIASEISNGELTLDGNGDGVGDPDDDYSFGEEQGLFRLFGDTNGDRHVDGADFVAFVTTYNLNAGMPGYLAHFDFNGDGRIDALDFGAFVQRYNQQLP